MKKQTSFRPLKAFHFPLLALLLVVCLLMPSTNGKAQETKPLGNLFGSQLEDKDQQVLSMARLGDTLYVHISDALFGYIPGDGEAKRLADMVPESQMRFFTGKEQDQDYQPRFTAVLSDGSRLLGLDPFAGALYTLTIENAAVIPSKPVTLDLAPFIGGEGVYRYVSLGLRALIDGRLYIKAPNYGELDQDLYSFDINTGQVKTHQVSHLQSLAGYKDGKLIALRQDPNQRYDEKTGEPAPAQLVLFDPQTDTLTETGASLMHHESSGEYSPLWYDQEQDKLFAYSDSTVLRFSGDLKTQEVIGYLPMLGIFWPVKSGLVPLSDGSLAIGFGRNVFLRPSTEEGLAGMTVITYSGAGAMEDGMTLQRALMDNDDLVLRSSEQNPGYLDQATLASLFLTKSIDVDLMTINPTGFDVDKLIDKGYLADLSQNPIIKAYMATLPDNLSKPLMREGAIFAVPFNLMTDSGAAYVKPFSELGLEIPKSVEDIITLAEQWVSGLGEEHPGYRLFSNDTNLKRSLRQMVLDKYLANKLGQGELVFDTPVFRKLMSRVEAMDYGDYALEINWEDPAAVAWADEYWQKTALLEFGMYIEPKYTAGANNSGDRRLVLLAIPLTAGEEAYQDADFTLLCVLSTGQEQQGAIRLLGSIIEKMNPVDKAAMDLSYQKDIENPNYEQELRTWQNNMDSYAQRLEIAQGAQKSDMEENLKSMQQNFDSVKESLRYLATAEDLANIHNLVSKLYLNNGLANAQRRAYYDGYDLQEKYFDGALTLDQFIKQMDDKMRLVRMEYQ